MKNLCSSWIEKENLTWNWVESKMHLYPQHHFQVHQKVEFLQKVLDHLLHIHPDHLRVQALLREPAHHQEQVHPNQEGKE